MNDDYLAGFIDGEGCFSLSVIPRTNRQFGYHYRAGLLIGNTNRNILDDIQEYLDGGFVTHLGRPNGRNRKQAYQYQISGKKQLYPILLRLIPKLIIKRKQAELVLQFLDRINTGIYRIDDNEVEARKKLAGEMRLLNHRGRYRARF